nr:reverse transcriptase domain-containing protein [Tanacetum cinerariifolium]
MHTRASNSELVEPLPEPERLNRRLHRRNRRVPFEQRNNPPQQPRVVYPPILDTNYFRHFLITLQNLNPMDDKPMWAADRVVALSPDSPITTPETANEFAIKGESVKVFMDDFSVFGNSFYHYLNNLDKMLQRCKDAHLVLNWEKCYFMVKEGIVLGYKVSEAGLEVDKEKIDVISKLLTPLISKVLEVS